MHARDCHCAPCADILASVCNRPVRVMTPSIYPVIWMAFLEELRSAPAEVSNWPRLYCGAFKEACSAGSSVIHSQQSST